MYNLLLDIIHWLVMNAVFVFILYLIFRHLPKDDNKG